MKGNNFKCDNEDSNEISTIMDKHEIHVKEGIGSEVKQDCLNSLN